MSLNNVTGWVLKPPDYTKSTLIDYLILSAYMPDSCPLLVDLDEGQDIDHVMQHGARVWGAEDWPILECAQKHEYGYKLRLPTAQSDTVDVPIPIEYDMLHDYVRGKPWGFAWFCATVVTGRKADMRAECSLPEEGPALLTIHDDNWTLKVGDVEHTATTPGKVVYRLRYYQTASAVISDKLRYALEAIAVGVPAFCPQLSNIISPRMRKAIKALETGRAQEKDFIGLGAECAEITKRMGKLYDVAAVTYNLSQVLRPTKPKTVRVALNAYNRCGMVRSAIRGAMRQTHPSIQLCIVDDCSSDNTIEAIEQAIGKHKRANIDVRVITLPKNSGCPTSWNVAMAARRNWQNHDLGTPDGPEWVTYTSSDNIQMAHQLYNLCCAAEAYGADVAVAPFYYWGGHSLVYTPQEPTPEILRRGGAITGASFVIRSLLLNETDLLPAHLVGIEDTALAHDLILCGAKFYYLSQPNYFYRIGHYDSMSFAIASQTEQWNPLVAAMHKNKEARTRYGWEHLRVLITNRQDVAQTLTHATIISPADFSCKDCQDPGRTQMFVDDDGVVKKCPFAKYRRGFINSDVLFNAIPHKCRERKE